jgi:Mrp family chromosome partitioning ATPase
VTDERRGRRSRPTDKYGAPKDGGHRDALGDPDSVWAEFRQRARQEIAVPNTIRRESTRLSASPGAPSNSLPPPPAGMPLPAPPPSVERVRTAPTQPLTQVTTAPPPPAPQQPPQPQPQSPQVQPAPPRPRETDVARQAAHAAAQLSAKPQPGDADPPPARNTTVFHKASLGSDASDLVRVYRMAPTRQIDARMFMLGAPDSPPAASFRVLRHRLADRKGVKVILVTSPRAREGKTMCAVNLALALSEAGRARVLLLEANLRTPALAQLFGFEPPMCIAEQLDQHRAGSTQPWIVVETGTPWLHTAAVSPDAKARPILDGPALAQCVDELRRAGYDYIVIDSPPILGSADVNIIEETVDGIVIAMWARRSRARALRKAVDQIGRSKLLGVVLLGG